MVNNKLENDVLTLINWFDENSSTLEKDFKKIFRINNCFGFLSSCVVLPTLFFGGSGLIFGNDLNNFSFLWPFLCVYLGLGFLCVYLGDKVFKKALETMHFPCFKAELNCIRLSIEKKASEELILKTIERAKSLNLNDALIDRLIEQKHENGLFWESLFCALNNALESEKQRTEVPKNLTLQQKKELLKTTVMLESVQVDAANATSYQNIKKSFWKI